MFVVSIKNAKRKLIAILAVILVIVTLAIVLTKLHTGSQNAEYADKKYSLAAGTNEEKITFFKQFGWNAETEPLSVKDVTIPQTFNDVYVNYNNIQKEQGLDLMPYAGKTCKQWVYQITNYPQQESMRGTILVYNDRVIGGDLSTPELNGFMTGFDGQINSNDYSLDQPTLSRDINGTLTAVSSVPASSATPEAKKAVSSQIPANAWPTD